MQWVRKREDKSDSRVTVERDIDTGMTRIHAGSDEKQTLNIRTKQRNGKKQMAMVRPSNEKKDKPKSSNHRPAHTTSRELSRHVRHERSVVPEVEEAGVDDDKPATVRCIEWKGSSYSSCDPYRKGGRFI